MSHRIVITIALSVVALAAAAPAEASFPGRNGSIAQGWFCSDEGCPIFYFQPGGGILVPAAIQPAHVAWSPDGRRLAFDGWATSLGTGRALYTVNADGTGLTQVGRGDRLRYNPAWSPDGRRLAFTQDNGAAGSGDVYTITTTGASLRRLTFAASWDGGPDWAPDGTRIAYNCRSGGKNQVCSMAPTGAGKTKLTPALRLPGSTSEPSWAPNSQSLTFSVARPDLTSRVYTMTRAGGSLRDITPLDGEGQRDGANPTWSPDGTRIAIEQACAGGPCFGSRSVKVDGTDPQWIFQSEDSVLLDPGAWQPLP